MKGKSRIREGDGRAIEGNCPVTRKFDVNWEHLPWKGQDLSQTPPSKSDQSKKFVESMLATAENY